MTTKSVELTNTAYTQLDTSVDSAIDMQNVSKKYQVRVVLAATIPAVSETAYYVIPPQKGLPRDGKTGLMWGMCEQVASTFVTVGE